MLFLRLTSNRLFIVVWVANDREKGSSASKRAGHGASNAFVPQLVPRTVRESVR